MKEEEKNRKLNDLLDALDFNQVVIFVKSVSRAAELDKLLVECNFPSICIHSGMSQEERFVFCFSCLLVFGSNLIMLDQLYGYNEYEIRDTQNKNKIPRSLK